FPTRRSSDLVFDEPVEQLKRKKSEKADKMMIISVLAFNLMDVFILLLFLRSTHLRYVLHTRYAEGSDRIFVVIIIIEHAKRKKTFVWGSCYDSRWNWSITFTESEARLLP